MDSSWTDLLTLSNTTGISVQYVMAAMLLSFVLCSVIAKLYQ